MTDLTTVRGIGPAMARAMAAMGIRDAEALAGARAEDLTALPRVQLVRARMLVRAAQELLAQPAEAPGPVAQAEVSEPVSLAEPEVRAAPEPKKKKAKKKKSPKPKTTTSAKDETSKKPKKDKKKKSRKASAKKDKKTSGKKKKKAKKKKS